MVSPAYQNNNNNWEMIPYEEHVCKKRDMRGDSLYSFMRRDTGGQLAYVA